MAVLDRYRMTLFHECRCRLSSTEGPLSNSDQRTKHLRRISQKLVCHLIIRVDGRSLNCVSCLCAATHIVMIKVLFAFFVLPPQRPLTRYLPIRYDDESSANNQTAFDLRAHIESAGHQLDDNGASVDRHFWIDSTSCRGYLKKLSGSGSNNNARRSGRKWLKRWFVFDRQSRTLSYYRHRSDDRSDAANQRTGAAAADKKITPRVSIRFQVSVCVW